MTKKWGKCINTVSQILGNKLVLVITIFLQVMMSPITLSFMCPDFYRRWTCKSHNLHSFTQKNIPAVWEFRFYGSSSTWMPISYTKTETHFVLLFSNIWLYVFRKKLSGTSTWVDNRDWKMEMQLSFVSWSTLSIKTLEGFTDKTTHF